MMKTATIASTVLAISFAVIKAEVPGEMSVRLGDDRAEICFLVQRLQELPA